MISDQDYRHGLSAEELVRALKALLAAERTAMRLTCRYLADLADCMGAADGWLHGRGVACLTLIGFADIYHAAECLFGLGAHSTRERIRVGKALRSLPRIEGALLSGELSYSRAREVTRVATPEDESTWLDRARTLPMRTLERRVVEATAKESPAGPPRSDVAGEESPAGPPRPDAAGKESPAGPPRSDAAGRESPAHLRWSTPETVEVTLRLPAEAWALLQRAMEGARRASEASLSDAEALVAVARDAMEQQSAGADPADPRHTVVLYECQSCLRAELDTGAGPLELGAGAAAALGCSARVRDLRTEGRVVRRGGPLPKAIERAVRLRDRNTCRVSGCHRRRYVDVHHILPRGEGGEHSRSNCVCLCTTHHARLHEGHLRIEGDAEGELMFYDKTGAPLSLPAASHSGTTTAPVTSHSGTAGAASASHSGMAVAAGAGVGEEAATLLALMGRRGGWSVDRLVEASGLRVGAVQSALLCLELDGRVAGDPFGGYAPCATPEPYPPTTPRAGSTWVPAGRRPPRG